MFVLSRSEGTMEVELALNGEEESDGPTTVVALEEGKIEGTGAEKVFTNEGTANDCVPVFGAPDKVEEIDESVPPEFKSIAERELWSAGTPPIACTEGAVTGCNSTELLGSES